MANNQATYGLSMILAALALVAAGGPARAATFPSTMPPAPAPVYSSVHLFFQDEHGGALYLGDGEFRLEGAYRRGPTGLAADLRWQNMPGYTPAVMDGRTLWQTGLGTSDLALAVGWRFGDDWMSVTPQLNLRGMFASGGTGDSMWAIGPGAILEYAIFPEASTIQLRYDHSIGISHSGAGLGPDTASAAIPLLHLDLRMSYRVIRPVEVSVGFQVRQLPADLGRGRLLTGDTVWLRGFYIGTGVLF